MKLEALISEMMAMNVFGRLWHWKTDVAQHHTSFEQFLTQNEQLTDSLVESSLGNDVKLNFKEIGVKNTIEADYSISKAQDILKQYRQNVLTMKKLLDESSVLGHDELVTILDDVTELCSKTLYLLKLK